MKRWCNILPMFMIRIIAAKHCERFRVKGVGLCVMPFPDVVIVIDKGVKP